jgi:hypothetical protein
VASIPPISRPSLDGKPVEISIGFPIEPISCRYWKTRKGAVIKEVSTYDGYSWRPEVFNLVTDKELLEVLEWREPEAESLADFCERDEV